MKRFNWEISFGISLIVASGILYFAEYLIFKDIRHTAFYMMGKVAFVPIEVLFVTLIIHRLLEIREKRSRLEKLNMVIGAFFSEVGTKLIAYFSNFDPNLDNIRNNLIVTDNWSEEKFNEVSQNLRNYDYDIDIHKVDLETLRDFLVERWDFLLRLLENPNLLEHESFTELLRPVCHLTEELAARGDVKQLPGADYKHLANDIKRAYILLAHQWLDYMKYLKDNYPYLFSLAMRTNPFDQEASPIIT